MFHNVSICNSIRAYLSAEIKNRNSLGLSYYIYKKTHPTEALKSYANLYKEDRCFIIGTGPSLKVEDVEMLDGEVCFGVNTLFKIYSKTAWRPNFYCVIDPETYENIKEQLKVNKVNNIFIAQNRMKNGFDVENCIPFNLDCSSFYKILLHNHLKLMKFSGDISEQVYDGASVMFATLQIAIYMGFKTIYLLGADCNYDTKILHAGGLGYSEDYNYNWTKQTGLTMIEGFKIAKKYADEHNINIFNATRGGMLEVFPRVTLEEII